VWQLQQGQHRLHRWWQEQRQQLHVPRLQLQQQVQHRLHWWSQEQVPTLQLQQQQ
jgi:hypothetical protein